MNTLVQTLDTPRCEPLIDVAFAARLLGVSKRQVTRMASARQIPAMQVGRYWKFRASLLDEWMRAQLQSAHSTCPPHGGSIA